jgi:hypothetical protein
MNSGTGYVDLKSIFEVGKTSGMKYFFIEQDGAPNPIVNVTADYNNLKKILS